jgi:alpha-D-ribose 1-methylphosphonate 5-triphosphate synthase subunit PhnH
MSQQANLLPGFDDYGTQSNEVFRTCLEVLSRPGHIVQLPDLLEAPAPLLPNAASIFLTLADFETTFWLDETLSNTSDVVEFLRFHTGAKQVANCADADFAIISDPVRMPGLSQFLLGTPEFPDRSTTLIIQVDTIKSEGWTFFGPGINGTISFSANPLPADFATQLAANRELFPRGVDLIFTNGTHIAALPRSVNLQIGE